MIIVVMFLALALCVPVGAAFLLNRYLATDGGVSARGMALGFALGTAGFIFWCFGTVWVMERILGA
jgi:hypothetical protein